MIKIFIADDSALMRTLLSDLFSKEADFQVIGTASNGREAVEKIKVLKPDLVTMDINMPIMDGIDALEIIMKECPTSVIMISSLTKAGADATIKALSLGAVDFIQKVSGTIFRVDMIKREILDKCRAAVKVNFKKTTFVESFPKLEYPKKSFTSFNSFQKDFKVASKKMDEKIIAIGTSTGGPRALQQVITKLPEDLPCGVVVVQHMPPGFTKSLAERLNSLSKVTVKEAEHNDVVSPGTIFIAPGNYHMTVESQGDKRVIHLNQDPPLASHRPAVDILFSSLAKFGDRVVAAILTGMGSDGAKGMKCIKEHGGFAIAEDESTAVVYGMPKAVVELGLADRVRPIDAIADELVQIVKK